MASEESAPDPATAEQVWIMTVHVVKHYAGTYEVLLYNTAGEEAAHAPLVPDATSMEDALVRFWSFMEGIAPSVASPFN